MHGARAETAKPAAQFTGGARREGDGEHVRRRDHAGRDRERDAVGDRAGLAGARTSQDADRAANGFDRLALLGVERIQDVGLGGQGHRPILAGRPTGAPVVTSRGTPGRYRKMGPRPIVVLKYLEIHSRRRGAHTVTAVEAPDQLIMYSTDWCGYCHTLKRQLIDAGITFSEVNIEDVEGAADLVQTINHGYAQCRRWSFLTAPR